MSNRQFYSTYAWVNPLKGKKGIFIDNTKLKIAWIKTATFFKPHVSVLL